MRTSPSLARSASRADFWSRSRSDTSGPSTSGHERGREALPAFSDRMNFLQLPPPHNPIPLPSETQNERPSRDPAPVVEPLEISVHPPPCLFPPSPFVQDLFSHNSSLFLWSLFDCSIFHCVSLDSPFLFVGLALTSEAVLLPATDACFLFFGSSLSATFMVFGLLP